MTVPENTAYAGSPTLTGTPVGDVTWSLEGTDAALLSINATTGALAMVARDYENPADSDRGNDYEITVKAEDEDGNEATLAITIRVTDVVGSANLGITAPAVVTVPENAAYSGTPTLTGTPVGDVTWSLEGTDAALMSIDSGSGALAMIARNYEDPADSDEGNDYEITVKAIDAGENPASLAITIRVTDVTESADLGITAPPVVTVPENTAYAGSPTLTGTPVGGVTWSLEGTDAALLSIDSGSGALAMVARNYEDPADADDGNDYEITVKAEDEDGNEATLAITIRVTDVTESADLGVTAPASLTVAENAAYSGTPALTGTPIGDVTWSLEGTDAALLSINAATGALSMVARNYEDPADADDGNDYEITVKAVDEDGNEATLAITIRVTDVTESADLGVTAPASLTVAENAAYAGTPTLTGTPIGAVAWSLEGTDAALLSINAATGALSMVARNYEDPADADDGNDYEVTVKAEDEDGNEATLAITIRVTDVTESATLGITAPAVVTVPENTAYAGSPTLTGTPIGGVTWSLEGTDAALLSINAATGALAMVARNYENPADSDGGNDYEITVKAEDEDGNEATASFTVSVTDVVGTSTLGITAPAVVTVPENTAYSGTPTLTGTPVGDVTWSLEGTDAALLSINATTGALAMIARNYEDPADSDEGNDYEITVKAIDAGENPASLAITIRVTDVTESADLGITAPSSLTVPENTAYSGTPTLTGTPIGDVTWSLEGTDAALLSINATTGALAMVARDYENPADSDRGNDYEITVKAEDEDGNEATLAITIRVTDVVGSANLGITAPAVVTVPENAAYSGTPTLTGTPVGDVTWSLEGTDAALMSIDSGSGALAMIARNYEDPADSDEGNDYEITVKAIDAGENPASLAITIRVTDVTESADLGITAPAVVTVPENTAYAGSPTLTGTPIGDVTWSLEGTDAALLSIDSGSGALAMVARNYEDPADADDGNDYEITVKAEDEDGNEATLAITIRVTDVTESADLGVTAPASLTVAENAAYSGTPALTGTPIGDVTWSLEGTDAALLSIDSGSGALAMVARNYEDPADADDGNDYEITVKAEDEDGNEATLAITIRVTDVTESADLGVTAPASLTVAENAAYSGTPALTGTPIGGVTWSLEGTDAALLSINAATGALSMVARNYENPADSDGGNDYEITVKAEDEDGNEATASFTVSVTDVVGTSTLGITAPAVVTVPENAAYSGTPTLTGTPVGDVTWSLEGTDAALMSIDSGSGALAMIARNYEDPADSDEGNDYEITVKAIDAGENPASLAITIRVTDVTESADLGITAPPVVTVPENTAYAGSPTLTGTPVGGVTWSLEGTDAALLSIDSGSGALAMVARNYEDPADADDGNDYEITVKAEDEDGNEATLAITIRVTDVTESADLGVTAPASLTVAENATYSGTPALTGTPIGDVTWSLEGTDAALLSINAATGALSMVARNYEDPADADDGNDYEVTVKAEDEDGNEATLAITIRVTDVTESATLGITAPAVVTVPENTAYAGSPTLTGTPIGDVTWSLEGTDAALLSIDSATGALAMIARNYEDPADSDDGNDYEVTVKAVDEDGNAATASFTVSVTDVTEEGTPGVEVDLDPDTVGIQLTRTVDEGLPRTAGGGGAIEYTIRLKSQPKWGVQIYVNTTGGIWARPPSPLPAYDGNLIAFNQRNWNVPKRVTIYAEGTLLIDDQRQATITHTLPDEGGYNRPAGYADVTVPAMTLTINDTTRNKVGFTTWPGTLKMQPGSSRVYEIRPKVVPTQNVTITLESSAASIATIDTDPNTPGNQSAITFRPQDFDAVPVSYNGSIVGYAYPNKEAGLGLVRVTGVSAGNAIISISNVSTSDPHYPSAPTDGGVKGVEVGTGPGFPSYSPMQDLGLFTLTPPYFSEFPEDRTTTAGAAFTYTVPEAIDEGDDAIAYAAALARGGALPSWLSFDPETRAFSGAPGYCDAPAALEIMVIATDAGRVPLSAAVTFTLTVESAADDAPAETPDENLPPVFGEVCALTVPENSPGGVNVGAPVTATDPNGDALSYIALDGADGAFFNLDADTGQITTREGVDYDYETKSAYQFMVIVMETDTAEGYLSGVSVTVNLTDVDEEAAPANSAPDFAASSATRAVAENSAAGTKVGSPITATDPDDGDTLTYSLSGTDAASFAIDASTGQITTKTSVDYDYETKSSYSLTVGASDGNGGTASIAVTVNLTDVNEAPVFGEGTADETGAITTTRQVAENSPAGTNVGLPIDVADPDAGDTLTYLLTGTDAASFGIVLQGQIATISGVTYDYETTPSYEIVVAVTDSGGLLNAIGVTVSLTDVAEGDTDQAKTEPINQVPSFDANIDTTLEVAENSGGGVNVGAPITATDPDEGDTLTYSLSGDDAASFSIGSGTGQITTKTGVTYDYEIKQSYSVTVDVSDGNGGETSTPVAVSLTDVNEAPVFTEGASATREVAEDSVAGTNVGAAVTATDPDSGDTLAYSLSGTDAASFEIGSSTGQITTRTGVTYDYETKKIYSVTVGVSDGNGGTDTIAVTVNLNDVLECHNKAGTFSETASFDGNWNAADCKAHHQDSRARYFHFTLDAETEVTITLSAGTLYVSGDTPNNGWGTTPGGSYEHRINTRKGNGKLLHDGSASTATLTLPAGDYTTEAAQTTDGGGTFTLGIGLTKPATSEDKTEPEPANQAPTFSEGASATRQVAENSAAGTNVGAAVTATDADTGDTLTYTLSGTDASSFEIGSSTGQITTKTGVTYDYETKKSYSLTVDVSDVNGGTDTIAVTVNITDVNEAPVFSEGDTATREVAENSSGGVNVGAAVNATDPDSGDTLTYTLSGTDASSFSIGSSTGQITTKTGVTYDYETKKSYSVTVGVSDGNGGTDSIAVTVSLTDVNETPPVVEKPDPPAPTPPTASAGADFNGKRGEVLTLSGSGTANADGSQALTYGWRISGASHTELASASAFLSSADSAEATFTMPRRKNMTDRGALDDGNWLEFELTVTDGDGEQSTDTVTVTISGTTWTAN